MPQAYKKNFIYSNVIRPRNLVFPKLVNTQYYRTYDFVLYLLPNSKTGSSLLMTLNAVGAVNKPFTLWSCITLR